MKVSKICLPGYIEADIIGHENSYIKQIIFCDKCTYTLGKLPMKTDDSTIENSLSSDRRRFNFDDLLFMFEEK